MARLEDEGEALLKSEEARKAAEERALASSAETDRLSVKVCVPLAGYCPPLALLRQSYCCNLADGVGLFLLDVVRPRGGGKSVVEELGEATDRGRWFLASF